jgi:Flp pilus assembly secretin CpaC
MQLHVKAVLSELDDLVTGVSIAATKTSGADVNVYMKPGQTLLIAGMLKNKKSKKISRFPILGYIPIIDIFFKSVKEEIIEKELLMLLTPTITVPGELSEFMQKLER